MIQFFGAAALEVAATATANEERVAREQVHLGCVSWQQQKKKRGKERDNCGTWPLLFHAYDMDPAVCPGVAKHCAYVT